MVCGIINAFVLFCLHLGLDYDKTLEAGDATAANIQRNPKKKVAKNKKKATKKKKKKKVIFYFFFTFLFLFIIPKT